MKARVKATGYVCEFQRLDSTTFLRKTDGKIFLGSELEFIEDDTDYWTRLEHQAAIGATQGLCANYTEFTKVNDGTVANCEMIAENARLIAHALVEKLKEKEERK